MKNTIGFQTMIVLAGMLIQPWVGAEEVRKDYPIQAVRFAEVRIEDAFWSPRLATNRVATVPHVLKMCEGKGIIDNFAKAAGLKEGPYSDKPWSDSVVGTSLCAAYHSLALQRDPALEAKLDAIVEWIGAAQEPDGYIYTASKLLPTEKLKPLWAYERWVNEKSAHELFNVGHLYEAAAASYEATGKRTFLDIMLKNADLVCSEFLALGAPSGHPQVEMALIKLYRVTGDRKYLDCAKRLIDLRGDATSRELYGQKVQDHLPVTQQKEAVGHQVCAGYLYAAMADVSALTGEEAYASALEIIWNDVVSKKMYLTGGPSGTGEDFLAHRPYHLPNKQAYCETCAAIAMAYWNHRMFLLSGDAKYMDVFERVLYNGLIAGISLDGTAFYYKNPLAADATNKFNHGHIRRSAWQNCPCCPPNIARFIPTVSGYVYGADQNDLYVNLFMGSQTAVDINKVKVQVRQETRYPWAGDVDLAIDPASPVEFGLRVRIPGWAQGKPVPSDLYHYKSADAAPVKLMVNDKEAPVVLDKGYAVVRRVWKKGDKVQLHLPMAVRRVVAHEKVLDNVGRVALERGPIVYCVEGVDNGPDLDSLVVKPGAALTAEFRPDLLGGVTVLRGRIEQLVEGGQTEPCELLAVPYSTWANRDIGPMAVWLADGIEAATVPAKE